MHLLFSIVIIGQLPHSEAKTWGVAHRITYGDNVYIYIYIYMCVYIYIIFIF